MTLRSLLEIVLRHRRVLAVGLVVSLTVAFVGSRLVRTDYEANGSVVFLSPSEATTPEGKPVKVNPFNATGTEVNLTNAILTITESRGFAERMADAGVRGDYEFRPRTSVIVDVEARASDERTALHAVDTGIVLLADELAERQRRAGAPTESFVTIDVLSQSDAAIPVSGSAIRVAGALFALGVVLTATVALVLEALPTWQRRWPNLRWTLLSTKPATGLPTNGHRETAESSTTTPRPPVKGNSPPARAARRAASSARGSRGAATSTRRTG